ncbi:DNA-deoxyinosine glycosylase [Paenibacillus sp. GCM10012307]|uniref:DNA-deoxyinosine glycosylase n=1 Tax=Paenibacillus roseus TaxID=2798579 RepID=A0A934IYI1_9BACL|nr:DNA-deoxyinosine glycosylase [Paenibacillus roseus]MBJ6361576.1 DNA-deoxyinosine glycosylase [Paenibacillus roseus]
MTAAGKEIAGFQPAADQSAAILILGSMPSEQSLQQHEYYGNPRNHFWPIMFAVFEQAPIAWYEERIDFLKSKGIALWDVLARCRRSGSLDANITDEQVNDFPAFYAAHPGIKLVLFNGTKAESIYRKQVGVDSERVFHRLPSSSPVPGKYNLTLEQKIEAWRTLLSI